MANAIPVHSPTPADTAERIPEIVGEPPEGFDMNDVKGAQKVVFHATGGYSVYW